MKHPFQIFHLSTYNRLKKIRKPSFFMHGSLKCLFMLPLLFYFLPLSGTTTPPKRILIIHSYSSVDPWTRELNAGFQEYLSKKGINAHYESQELDVRGTLDVKPSAQAVEQIQDRSL